MNRSEVLKYFVTRPVDSKIGAWASNQSRIITTRKLIEMKFEEIKRKFSDGKVPLPSFWGGYRVIPRSIAFWQGRPSRLHDPTQYSIQEDGAWQRVRLAP